MRFFAKENEIKFYPILGLNHYSTPPRIFTLAKNLTLFTSIFLSLLETWHDFRNKHN